MYSQDLHYKCKNGSLITQSNSPLSSKSNVCLNQCYSRYGLTHPGNTPVCSLSSPSNVGYSLSSPSCNYYIRRKNDHDNYRSKIGSFESRNDCHKALPSNNYFSEYNSPSSSYCNITEISRITNHLYLSGCHDMRESKLRSLNIKLVINASLEVSTLCIRGIRTLRVPLYDSPTSNISSYFNNIADRIYNEYQRGGNILVHCVAGVSRSVSLVLAYLVKYSDMNLRQAFFFVKSKRPFIRPNNGFWNQLINFEKTLRGKSSVKMTRQGMISFPDVYAAET